jgi:hypothetical protein
MTPPALAEKHHSKPKCRGGKDSFIVCIDCGDMLHKLFTNKELDKEFQTVVALLSDERVKKWRAWAWNKRFGACMRTKKRRG